MIPRPGPTAGADPDHAPGSDGEPGRQDDRNPRAMRAGAILETVIYCDDVQAMQAFYADVLGLTPFRTLPGKFAFFTCGAQMLLVFDRNWSGAADRATTLPLHATQGPGHLCFRAKDTAEIDAWRVHLARSGVAIEHEETWPEGGLSLYFRDPAGNSVEIAEPLLWGL